MKIFQKKIPIIFIENKKINENNYISAKNAALSSWLASKRHYLLDDKMKLIIIN